MPRLTMPLGCRKERRNGDFQQPSHGRRAAG
jgi:hypothetical protein